MQPFTLRTTGLAALAGIGVLELAHAETAETDTKPTFTPTAGARSISPPTGTVSLGSRSVTSGSGSITGSLGLVTVSDLRGGPTRLTVSVIATESTPVAGPADPASTVSYDAGRITDSPLVIARSKTAKSAYETLTTAVPHQVASGVRYAVARTQVSSGPNGAGVTLLNRVGVGIRARHGLERCLTIDTRTDAEEAQR